jgi:hypothetical protein
MYSIMERLALQAGKATQTAVLLGGSGRIRV